MLRKPFWSKIRGVQLIWHYNSVGILRFMNKQMILFRIHLSTSLEQFIRAKFFFPVICDNLRTDTAKGLRGFFDIEFSNLKYQSNLLTSWLREISIFAVINKMFVFYSQLEIV